MKINFTKDMKKVFTLADMEAIKVIKTSLEDQKDFDWEVNYAALLASNNNVGNVIQYKAYWSKNGRIADYYGEGSGQVDVWIEIYAYDTFYGFYEIGAYISDIWSISSDNHEEIKSNMYINAFTRKG